MTQAGPWIRGGRAALCLLSLLVADWSRSAAQAQTPVPAAPRAQTPAPAPPAAAEARPPAEAPSSQWQELPAFVVERVFRGPLRDTVVQRLRDPVDGSTCFIYLPMSAAVAGQSQFLVYGSNTIGSISCFGPAHVIQLQQVPPPPVAAAPPASAPSRQR